MELPFSEYSMFIQHLITHNRRHDLFELICVLSPNSSNSEVNTITDFLFVNREVRVFKFEVEILSRSKSHV